MRSFLIGVDEVGRGALAGQVYAAAVILRNEDLRAVPTYFLSKLKDSGVSGVRVSGCFHRNPILTNLSFSFLRKFLKTLLTPQIQSIWMNFL